MGTLTWYPEFRDYTFDIASQLLVGTPDGSQTPLCKLFEVWVEGLFSIPFALPWTKFGKAKACREDLLTQIEEIVKQRQKQDNSGEDALGLLLQAKDEQGNSLSLAELKDQILLLLFAGHETLTSAVASFCLLMAQHPDVVDIAREEQEKLGIDLPFTPESLAKMTYLEQVLKETLRLVPPVGGGFREAIADCEYDGYVIPKGWRVQYQIGRTHQDENIYPNSKEFDPDRFNPSRSEDKQKTFAYVPFGGGLRECIGKEFAKLEMKILAAMLLRHYQWELLPEQDLELVTIPTPHPRDNLRVKFSLRQ